MKRFLGHFPSLVISLDFELFWGVSDAQNISGYGNNILGVWDAIPKMLGLFKEYEVNVTWATVGMLMCRDYRHWSNLIPTDLPKYLNPELSSYSLNSIVKNNQKLFFARPLVEEILETPGQEVATHTYSHFYCNEKEVSLDQFDADIRLAIDVAKDLGVKYRSFVFPRNQVSKLAMPVLNKHGIKVFRGNQNNWIYKDGHDVPFGLIGRGIRLLDSLVPVTGDNFSIVQIQGDGLINLPASFFVRPWCQSRPNVSRLHLNRLKKALSEAAISGSVCHLWWHPHNFGINLCENLSFLEELLIHFRLLKDNYGMISSNMGDFYPNEIIKEVSSER